MSDSNIKTYFILAFIALIILILPYILLMIFLPHWIIIIIYLLALRQLGRSLCQLAVFPASFKLYLRNRENLYGVVIAKTNYNTLKHFQQFLKALLDLNADDINVHEVNQFSQWLSQQLFTYQYMRENGRMSKYQRQYLLELIQLDQSIRDIQINGISLTNILTDIYDLTILIKQDQQISMNNTKIYSAQSTIQNLMKMAAEVIGENQSPKQHFQVWLYNDTFGSLDQLRVQIEKQHHAKRIFLQSYDATTLDVILIPVIPQVDYAFQQSMPICFIISYLGPTVIFCSPNACHYEFFYYDTDWIEYYLNLGINVVMWNYRGYGHSSGDPSIKALQKDGEVIVDLLRKQYQVKVLGVHGYSLGGAIASYIANKKQLDFLFADRTFLSLSSVGAKSFGKYLTFLFGLLTDWDQYNYKDYLNFNGHKLIGIDYQDELELLRVASFHCNQLINNHFVTVFQVIPLQEYNQCFDMEKIVIQFFFSSYLEFSDVFFKNIIGESEFRQLNMMLSKIASIVQNLKNQAAFENIVPTEQQDNESLISLIETVDESQLPESTQLVIENYDEQFIAFIKKIVAILSIPQTLSMNLLDIYLNCQGNQIELLQVFFVCCQCWGSFDMSNQFDIKPINMKNSRQKMNEQFKEFISRMEDFQSEMHGQSGNSTKIQLIRFMRVIQEKVQNIVNNLHEFGEIRESKIGKAFSLRCRHNSTYNSRELKQLSVELQNSNLIQ